MRKRGIITERAPRELDLAYIRARLPREELLAQLAEEGAELTHAALKLRRALDGTNPTPVIIPDAVSALMEEVSDVLLLISLLSLDQDKGDIQATMDFKLSRWRGRLQEKEAREA